MPDKGGKPGARPTKAEPQRSDKAKNARKPLGPGPGYASVHPEPGQARAVAKWLAGCGIKDPMPARQMHVTLIYDKRNKRFDVERRRGALYAARPRSVEMLGGGHLVLVLDSRDLSARHQALIDAGYQHSFQQFRPHVTLKSGATDEDFLAAIGCIDRLVKAVPKMTLYKETWVKVDENWKPKAPSRKPAARPSRKGGGILSVAAADAEEASMDKPFKWDWDQRQSGIHSANFPLPAGGKYQSIHMLIKLSSRSRPRIGELVFSAVDSRTDKVSFDPTGQGSAFRVLATVVDFAIKSMDEMDLDEVYFSSKGPSRTKLYARVASAMAARHGMTVEAVPSSGGRPAEFYMVRDGRDLKVASAPAAGPG